MLWLVLIIFYCVRGLLLLIFLVWMFWVVNWNWYLVCCLKCNLFYCCYWFLLALVWLIWIFGIVIFVIFCYGSLLVFMLYWIKWIWCGMNWKMNSIISGNWVILRFNVYVSYLLFLMRFFVFWRKRVYCYRLKVIYSVWWKVYCWSWKNCFLMIWCVEKSIWFKKVWLKIFMLCCMVVVKFCCGVKSLCRMSLNWWKCRNLVVKFRWDFCLVMFVMSRVFIIKNWFCWNLVVKWLSVKG